MGRLFDEDRFWKLVRSRFHGKGGIGTEVEIENFIERSQREYAVGFAERIIAMAGNPNAVDGCRLIIKEANALIASIKSGKGVCW